MPTDRDQPAHAAFRGPPPGWRPLVPGDVPPACICGAQEWHWKATHDRPAQNCEEYRAWIINVYGACVREARGERGDA